MHLLRGTLSSLRPSVDTGERATGIPAAPRGQARMVLVVVGSDGIREFQLSDDRVIVGRSAAASFRIEEPSVSRTHAELCPHPDGWLIRDLGSRNGTSVNGVALPPDGRVVGAGEAIRFGDVHALLRLHAEPAVSRAPLLSIEQLSERLSQEADRAICRGQSLSIITLRIVPLSLEILEAIRMLRIAGAGLADAVVMRSADRVDVLVLNVAQAEAAVIARRIQEAVGPRAQVHAGVASFPGDAPSSGTLLLAADAVLGAGDGGVGVSGTTARTLRAGSREILVADPVMVRLYAQAELMASLAMPLLITGETGTGKEVIADVLHAFGPRSQGPFVKLNCVAMPDSLLEAELFGYERGAFTGATAAKPGLFEEADKGTLLLDEIGEMPLALQSKLLRVLEDHKVRRIGAVRDKTIDVRVLAATNRNLEAAVQEGTFRRDLLYRLNTLVLSIPPLRERRREIGALAVRFVAEAAAATGRPAPRLGKAALALLEESAWPGNIRELRNVMSRAVVACQGSELERVHLLPLLPQPEAPRRLTTDEAGAWAQDIEERDTQTSILPLEEQRKAFERNRIIQALESCGGNQTKAAELLQMPRRTLVSKISSLGIRKGQFR